MNTSISRSLTFVLAVLALFVSGCEGTISHMREVPAGAPVTAPDPGKALIVFMRPSTLGFAIQSSVFEMKGDTPTLVGIIAAKTKVAHQVSAGEYLFMVIGENADFMTAEVLAGRTYHVRVEPRMGLWKARFGLEPVRQAELATAGFAASFKGCRWVEKTPDAEGWAASGMTSIQSKRAEYYPDWIKQPEADRPRLLPQDGK